MPLKNEDIELPNNRDATLRRLNQLKGGFESRNNQKYHKDHTEFMKMIDSGYAEQVPKVEGVSSVKPERKRSVCYIPHHGVYHHKKTKQHWWCV